MTGNARRIPKRKAGKARSRDADIAVRQLAHETFGNARADIELAALATLAQHWGSLHHHEESALEDNLSLLAPDLRDDVRELADSESLRDRIMPFFLAHDELAWALLAYLPEYDPFMRQTCRRLAFRARRRACADVRLAIRAPRRTCSRARGAGRPRAKASHSSSRSGDSGDDGPGEPAPAHPRALDRRAV